MHYGMLFLAIITTNHCFGMDMNLFQKQQKNENTTPNGQQIIFLNGTTTAGKSSIASLLKERLEEKSQAVEVLAIDTFIVPKIQWTLGINRLNPCNVFVSNSDLITPAEIEAMATKSQVELCAAARTAYEKGKIVIIDAPAYRPDLIASYQQEFKGLNVLWSLVYCPVSTLVERVINRNETSGITGQRSILQALDQFSRLYSSQTTGSKTVCSIDTLSQEVLCNTCNEAQRQHDIMQNEIPGFLKGIQKAICPFDFDTIKKLMFEKFTLNENIQTNIGPVVQHNCVVNTGLDDSAACAEKIMHFLQSHSKISANTD